MSEKFLDESSYLTRCCQLIEEIWQNGKSKHWRDSDYKVLSTLISEKAHISISPDTLKRLFGKIKTFRTYNPQAETKNALAIFLDFKNWEEFKKSSQFSTAESKINTQFATSKTQQNGNAETSNSTNPSLVSQPIQEDTRKINAFVWISLVLLMGIASYFIINSEKKKSFTNAINKTTEQKIVFTSKSLKGLAPYTVVFQYDISSVNSDSIYIDYGYKDFGYIDKELLSKDKHTITHYYDAPGFYEVRVLVGQKVLSTLEVEITFNSWKSQIYLNNKKIVFVDDKVLLNNYKQSRAYISLPQIHSIGIDTNQVDWIEFRNIQAFPIDGENFIFETRFKNNKSEGGVHCLESIIRILGQNNILRLQFNKLGCSRWAIVQFGEKEFDGKYTDLSPFSTDVSIWRTVRLEAINKKVKVFLDNNLIYTASYQKPIVKIKGIVYNFRGCGSVDFVKLFDAKNKLVFYDDFNK